MCHQMLKNLLPNFATNKEYEVDTSCSFKLFVFRYTPLDIFGKPIFFFKTVFENLMNGDFKNCSGYA